WNHTHAPLRCYRRSHAELLQRPRRYRLSDEHTDAIPLDIPVNLPIIDFKEIIAVETAIVAVEEIMERCVERMDDDSGDASLKMYRIAVIDQMYAAIGFGGR